MSERLLDATIKFSDLPNNYPEQKTKRTSKKSHTLVVCLGLYYMDRFLRVTFPTFAIVQPSVSVSNRALTRAMDQLIGSTDPRIRNPHRLTTPNHHHPVTLRVSDHPPFHTVFLPLSLHGRSFCFSSQRSAKHEH